MISRMRRWTPERRAFIQSVVVRPSMLAAVLLLLWGHVSLAALIARAATHGASSLVFTLFEAPGDRAAAILNAALAFLALLFWLLIGIGFIQRRIAHRQSAE